MLNILVVIYFLNLVLENFILEFAFEYVTTNIEF